MLRFARTTGPGPLADAKSAERWLQSLAGIDPLARHRALSDALHAAAKDEAPRTPARLAALFRVDAGCTELHTTLVKRYLDEVQRPGRNGQQVWQALLDVEHAFLVAYERFARSVAQHPGHARWKSHEPELIGRELQHMARDAALRMFRCEPWIPAKWLQLHEVFARACGRRIERVPLTFDAGTQPSTIEQHYIATLLLQLMNTGSLRPVQVEWLARQLPRWCASLHLTRDTQNPLTFFVDLGERHGLRRRGQEPLRGRVLFLDTQPVLGLLEHYVLALDAKIRSEPLSQRSLRRVEHQALVNKLAAQVAPEFRPLARRAERTQACGSTDAIVGLARITGFLHEEQRVPAHELDTSTTFGDTLDLAVFGRRRGLDPVTEMAQRRLATYAAAGGLWDLKDTSDTGVRVQATEPTRNGLVVGALVLLRAERQITWTLTVLRRMKRLSTDRAELGLEVIADSAVLVELEPAGAAGRGASAEGEPVPARRRSVRALFLLMKARARERAPVQSVVIATADYHAGTRYTVRTRSASYAIRFGRPMEQHQDWAWVIVEPISMAREDSDTGPGPDR